MTPFENFKKRTDEFLRENLLCLIKGNNQIEKEIIKKISIDMQRDFCHLCYGESFERINIKTGEREIVDPESIQVIK